MDETGEFAGSDPLGELEAAFDRATETPRRGVPGRTVVAALLPVLCMVIGAIVALIVFSGPHEVRAGDGIQTLILLPYLVFVGAVAGAILGGVAALVILGARRRIPLEN